MPVKLRVKQKRNNQKFMELLAMNRQKIEVGTVTDYAIRNFSAFGLSHVLDSGSSRGVPGWNYNEKALKDFRERGRTLFLKGVNGIVKGGWSVSAMTNQIGIEAAARYKAKIESIKSPPNAPSTIARKGFNNPMIETGRFKANIAARINGGRVVGRGLG